MRRLVIVLVGPLLAACGLSVVGVATTSEELDAGADGATGEVATADGPHPNEAATPDADASVDATLDADASVAVSGPTLSATTDSVPATIELTTEGTTDWVFWGNAQTQRKATGGGRIAGYTESSDPGLQYASGGAPVHWSDGTPLGTADSNQVALFGRTSVTLAFTAPSSATPQRFVLYVGGESSTLEIDAMLGSATVATPIHDQGTVGQYSARYAVTFSSPTADTLTVKMRLVACAGTCGANSFFALNAATLATP